MKVLATSTDQEQERMEFVTGQGLRQFRGGEQQSWKEKIGPDYHATLVLVYEIYRDSFVVKGTEHDSYRLGSIALDSETELAGKVDQGV